MIMESLLLSVSLLTVFLSLSYTLSFNPVDNFLVDCGSSAPTTVDSDNRVFSSDSIRSESLLLTSLSSFSIATFSSAPGLSPIYRSARIFKSTSAYVFTARQKGTHLIRLHFHGLDHVACRLSKTPALFHVSANNILLLTNFTAPHTGSTTVKDYLIWVDSDKVEITFIPASGHNIAYVNAIEVISAPKDLIADVADSVTSDKIQRIDGLMTQALEIVYRVNVGGPKVTPFNDTLPRNWIPDDEFLKLNDGVRRVYYSGRINYRLGGASREVAPDNVYNTGRVIGGEDLKSVPDLNISYSFPVVDGYRYLVRLHFCDIASMSLGLLYFNVYVNGNLAYYNLDLSKITNWMLASPFYADFVVDGDELGLLNVSVGPSNMSNTQTVDAILNGIEIMKLNNSMGSLDGKLSAKMVLKTCQGGVNFLLTLASLLTLVAVACLLVASLMVIYRRFVRRRDSVPWMRLPVDVSEVSLNYKSQTLSGKA